MENPRHRLIKISQKIICLIAVSTAIQTSAAFGNAAVGKAPTITIAAGGEAALSAPTADEEADNSANLPETAGVRFSYPNLPAVGTNLPGPDTVQRPDTPSPSAPGESHQSLPPLKAREPVPVPGKPYFEIRRIPGNIEVFPGGVQLFQTYVTNIGTGGWTGFIEDTFTNSYYMTVRNYHATTGKVILTSRTGSLNGKVVPFLRWEGSLIPGQTVLISYEVAVAPNTPRGVTFESMFYSGMEDVSGSCTWGYYTVCQRILKVQLPPNIQVHRSPGDTTVIPGITETHYIYFTNSSGLSWSGFIDEEFSGYENMNISNARTTRGNVTRPHASYMRWSGTIGPKQTVTLSYQTTAKQDAAHGAVFKARFYTGLNEVANNCLRDISQCERTTTILIPPRFEVFRTVTSVIINNGADTTYTITIKNTGGIGASTRGLVETMADKMVYAGVSGGTPAPARVGQKISWPSVYLKAGAQIVYRYKAHPFGAASQEELTNVAVVGDVRGNCTLGSADRACQSTVFVREPATIQVLRSPGNTTIIPGVTETHYIYVTNTGGASWSGFIDEEFTGQENMIIGRVQATRGNVTRLHPSYMRWSGIIGPGETITVSYQSVAKSTAAHGAVFKARFYTGLNEVANNCLRNISQCERTTTIHLPSKH